MRLCKCAGTCQQCVNNAKMEVFVQQTQQSINEQNHRQQILGHYNKNTNVNSRIEELQSKLSLTQGELVELTMLLQRKWK